MRIHLDTDLGGDPDDACALALLLGWPEVELVGITTAIDHGGRRAGYTRHLLDLAGRTDVPLAAGAAASLTTRRLADPVVGDPRYWPAGAVPLPGPPGAALDLLAAGVEAGATIVAIGPCTNLALLEIARPGSLAGARVVLMGGWVRPPADGLPAWGPEMDWNIQWDTVAARIVAETANLTLATLPATLAGQLRSADLPRLAACGPLGELLARQCEVYGPEAGMPDLGRAHPGLPDDLLNFHYDPLAAAAAVGWPGAAIREERLRPVQEGEFLRFVPDPDGRSIGVMGEVDGPGFTEAWLAAVERVGRVGHPLSNG